MISIIAAVAANRAIGNDNKLIYWLPDDLKRFKALTTGNTIIMGRRTFESLPKGALLETSLSDSIQFQKTQNGRSPSSSIRAKSSLLPAE